MVGRGEGYGVLKKIPSFLKSVFSTVKFIISIIVINKIFIPGLENNRNLL